MTIESTALVTVTTNSTVLVTATTDRTVLAMTTNSTAFAVWALNGFEGIGRGHELQNQRVTPFPKQQCTQ